MNRPIGYLQQHMLDFCKRYPGRHYITPDAQTIKIARSLERRGLLQITDCGMADARGRSSLMVSYVEPQTLPDPSQQPQGGTLRLVSED
jgi:hypothetical protein